MPFAAVVVGGIKRFLGDVDGVNIIVIQIFINALDPQINGLGLEIFQKKTLVISQRFTT